MITIDGEYFFSKDEVLTILNSEAEDNFEKLVKLQRTQTTVLLATDLTIDRTDDSFILTVSSESSPPKCIRNISQEEKAAWQSRIETLQASFPDVSKTSLIGFMIYKLITGEDNENENKCTNP